MPVGWAPSRCPVCRREHVEECASLTGRPFAVNTPIGVDSKAVFEARRAADSMVGPARRAHDLGRLSGRLHPPHQGRRHAQPARQSKPPKREQ